MSRPGAARVTFGLTALVAAVGLGISLFVAATTDSEQFASAGARALNQLCFFTLQSNIVVAIVSALLAVRLEWTSPVFAVFRLVAVVDIFVTGVVYYLVLRQPQDTVLAWTSNTLLHAVVPLACVLGWLVFGPRGLTSVKVAAWATLVPLAWLALTLVRGAVIDWYPYPFVDVSRHGYGTVMLNVAVLAVVFVALYAAAIAIDRRLAPDVATEAA